MNPRLTAKDRGLIKGAIRRAFSRSELRRQVIEASVMKGHTDSSRPRVKKWCKCAVCAQPTPKSYMVADHIEPVIPVTSTFEEMSLDETVDRMWCDIKNLQPICPTCHDSKTASERNARKVNKRKK